MQQHPTSDILAAMTRGDRSRAEQLWDIVYNDLRRLAQNYLGQEQIGHSLQASDLVHEAFLKLADQRRVDWKGRSHFFAIGAQAMRRILVNHARSKKRIKRGGGRRRQSLDEALTVSVNEDNDVLALEDAIKKLESIAPQQARIVELRFYGGLTMDETAEALGLSKRTVEREWTGCRAWLRRELSNQGGS